MGLGTLVWATAAGLATGSVVLAVVVWLTERRFHAGAREVPAPGATAASPAAGERMTALRIVHVVAEGDIVTIDALVDKAGTGDLGPAGTPLALRLRRAETPWFDETTCRLLEEWAEDNRIIQIAVRRRAQSAATTATLRSGASMMKLSLLG